jgi:uncharacterized tellurite resistance protein B-like protein
MPDRFDATEAQEIVRALAAVAAADGAILHREEVFLEGFAVKHGIGAHTWFASPLDETSLARAVTDPGKRREVVALCLEMAHSDQKFVAEEVAMIRRIASAFAISDADLEQLMLAAKIKR